MTDLDPDVIVVGAGLAGLVATHELVKAGKRVLVLDQENRNNLGGQAFWSLGGLFFVDSPEQRRMGIKDSPELALQDWLGSAGFDRRGRGRLAAPVGRGLRRLAAATGKRDYLRGARPEVAGLRRLGRARRRQRQRPRQLGAALPPHLGHRPRGGPGLRASRCCAAEAARAGPVRVPAPGRRAVVEDDAVVGVRGTVLDRRRRRAWREVVAGAVGEFELRAPAVVVTSGGIGHNFDADARATGRPTASARRRST